MSTTFCLVIRYIIDRSIIFTQGSSISTHIMLTHQEFDLFSHICCQPIFLYLTQIPPPHPPKNLFVIWHGGGGGILTNLRYGIDVCTTSVFLYHIMIMSKIILSTNYGSGMQSNASISLSSLLYKALVFTIRHPSGFTFLLFVKIK
jgi:hypothetical protein